MRNILTILFLFVISGALSAAEDDAAQRYNEFLPKSLASNPEFLLMLDKSVDNLAEADPLLIYRFLNYADKFWGQNIKKSELNGWDEIKYLRGVARKQRSEWFADLKAKIEPEIKSRLQRLKLVALLDIETEKDAEGEKDVQLYSLDTNRQFYCGLKYVSGTWNDKYEENRNYKLAYFDYCRQLADDFVRKSEVFQTLDRQAKDELIKTALKNWRIFLEEYRKETGIDAYPRLQAVILAYIKDLYSQKMKVGIEAAFETDKWNMDYNVNLSDIPLFFPKYNTTHTIRIKDQFSITALFSLPLEGTQGFLSSLDLRVGYVLSKAEFSPDFGTLLITAHGVSTGAQINSYFYQRKREVNAHKFSFSLSVPVFNYSDRISLHAGIFSSVQKLNVDYYYEQIKQTSTLYGHEYEITQYPHSINKTRFEVFPWISARAEIFGCTIFATIKSSQSICGGVGYYIPF